MLDPSLLGWLAAGIFAALFPSSSLDFINALSQVGLVVFMSLVGMVELVALNIGLDLGVISPLVFTLLVLMAIVTTFMATPLLELLYPTGMRSNKSAKSVSELRPQAA